ncbi:hypothetical protein B0H19DRAFT_1082961 [Mycena capillaripes]|nr:hypothetical protein B0H19DRAFT_1082961 [Mycena capillaripes]
MSCKSDPRIPNFYHQRHALAVVTAKLKYRGEEKKGLDANTISEVDRKLAQVAAKIDRPAGKENSSSGKEKAKSRKKRCSADRDLAVVGVVLSPRKRRMCSRFTSSSVEISSVCLIPESYYPQYLLMIEICAIYAI